MTTVRRFMPCKPDLFHNLNRGFVIQPYKLGREYEDYRSKLPSVVTRDLEHAGHDSYLAV